MFSSITLTHLLTSGMVSIKEDDIPIVPGSSNHQSHLPLEMFVRSKVVAEAFYSDTLSQGVTTQVQKEIKELMELNCGDDLEKYPDHSNKYVENIWTRRLFQALKYHCSDLNPQRTMHDANGGGFAKKVLLKWSRMEMSASSVPLHGSPDLTTDSTVFSILSDDEAYDALTDDSDAGPVEVATTKLTVATGMKIAPEKLGELGAAMLTKAYCSMAKDICLSHNIKHEYVVHDTLLNKFSSEAIQVAMKVPCLHISKTSNPRPKTASMMVRVQPTCNACELCQSLNYWAQEQ